MNRYLTTAALIAICLAASSSAAPRLITTDASVMTRAGLPTEQMAKTLLSEALQHRHPQWIDIPSGSTTIRSFVVFPDGGDNVPVVVLSANDQTMSDWLRAVGDEAAQDGFIAVVPEHRAEAVTQYALHMPGSNGNGASVNFNFTNSASRIETTIESPSRRSTSFQLT